MLHEDSTDADTDADTSMDADPDESAMEVDSPPNRKSKKRELDSGMNRRTMDERVCLRLSNSIFGNSVSYAL